MDYWKIVDATVENVNELLSGGQWRNSDRWSYKVIVIGYCNRGCGSEKLWVSTWMKSAEQIKSII